MPTIVLGYTQTDEGEAALTQAITEAGLRGSRLEVVHSRRKGQDRDLDDIERYVEVLEGVGRRLDEAGVEHTIHDLIQGHSPSEDVINCAVDTGADLIVIGIRTRTRTGKYLLGSVAQDILLGAPCAVLAVKADSPLS